jgi:hypothetical protein
MLKQPRSSYHDWSQEEAHEQERQDRSLAVERLRQRERKSEEFRIPRWVVRLAGTAIGILIAAAVIYAVAVAWLSLPF